MTRKIYLASVLLSLTFIVSAQAQTPSAMGIRELLLEAQKSQLDWQQALIAVKQAEETVTLERSGFLPDLALTSSVSRDWQQSSIDRESTSSQAAIESRWTLFDNGLQFREYNRSKIALERARAEEHRIREEVAYNLLSRYANYLLLLRQKEISERKLELYQTQFRMSQRQFRQGLKTRSDNSRLESEVERANLDLLRYQNSLQTAFEELKRFLGADAKIQSPQDLKLIKTRDIFTSLAAAPSNNQSIDNAPSVRSSRLALEIQKILTRDQQVNLWPGIYLTGAGGYGSDNFVDSDDRFSDRDRFFATAGIKMSWTIFNWGGVTSQYQRALLAERLSEAQLAQTQLNVKTSQARYLRDAGLLDRSVKVRENLLAIETRTFRDIETEYREGRASYLDLSTSLERRFQAELQLEQDTLDSLINIAGQRQLLGTLYEACLQL